MLHFLERGTADSGMTEFGTAPISANQESDTAQLFITLL
jgi:hypothetical protein